MLDTHMHCTLDGRKQRIVLREIHHQTFTVASRVSLHTIPVTRRWSPQGRTPPSTSIARNTDVHADKKLSVRPLLTTVTAQRTLRLPGDCLWIRAPTRRAQ